MFGFYELYIPHFAQVQEGSVPSHRSLFNCFMLGMFSGTITSPCLTPALALLLGVAAKQAHPLIGFGMLLCFALGMSILLLIVGTFSSSLALLPRAGEWMDHIKRALGFVLLAMCGYFAQNLIGATTTLIVYWCVALAATVYYWTKGRTGVLAILLGAFAALCTLMVSSMLVQLLLR
jgi:thiol:disulfide interchange protein DsbD